jgi:hypothetical protein
MNVPNTHAAQINAGGQRKVPETEPAGRASRDAAPREPDVPAPGDARVGNYSGTPGHTVAAIKARTGIDPVVGWLVCIKGANKGRDYRLHSDRNQLGRAPNMDVCIEGDETISRENHCQIVFSPRTRSFSLIPGAGRNLIYLNGQDVVTAMQLLPHDKIDLGEGGFVFVPFCTGEFDWESPDEGEKKHPHR